MSERVHKSVLNAEVNLLFYLLSIFLAFFLNKILFLPMLTWKMIFNLLKVESKNTDFIHTSHII